MDNATTSKGKRIIFLTFKFAPLLENTRSQFSLFNLACLYSNMMQLYIYIFLIVSSGNTDVLLTLGQKFPDSYKYAGSL